MLPVHGGEHERGEASAGGGVRPSPGLQELRSEGPMTVLDGHQEGTFRLSRKRGKPGGKQSVNTAKGMMTSTFLSPSNSWVSSFLSCSKAWESRGWRWTVSHALVDFLYSREHRAQNRKSRGAKRQQPLRCDADG